MGRVYSTRLSVTATNSRRMLFPAICLLVVVLASACSPQPESNSDADLTAGPGSPVAVKVMTFNIEWGGKHVSFNNVVEAIRQSGADIVGVQEAEGNLQELAAALDWNFDERNYVISRFPLIDPPEAMGKYLFVELRPNEIIAVSNVHLPSDPYGPDLLRSGTSINDVIANEHKVRMPMLKSFLESLAPLVDAKVPTFVTGDFNSLSHKDPVTYTVGSSIRTNARVNWPVTIAVEKAGFRDSWREVFPDASSRPGFTWWAARPPLETYAPGADDPQGRIDMIWSSGPVVTQSALLVGEAGRPGVSVFVDPWPSDHRGLVSTFYVEPVSMPDVLSTDRHVYGENQNPEIIFNFAQVDAGEILVTAIDTNTLVEKYRFESSRGAISIAQLRPGRYAVEAVSGGETHIRNFHVLADGAIPSIEVTKPEFGVHEPVVVRWNNAPGYRNDYVAIYASNVVGDDRKMLGFAYVDSQPAGEMDLRAALLTGSGILTPGKYVAKLMKDDGYEVLAETGEFGVGYGQ